VESLTSGTLAGTGSFRCEECGYVVTLAAADELPTCPGCGSSSFARASLFSGVGGMGATRFARGTAQEKSPEERATWLAEARRLATDPGQYLIFERDGKTESIPIEREWTRVGRSLAADVRFDDPTVSRRHALIVRQADGVRVLDDRSLNGVFVNGERVEWRELLDGDEIVVGRYRLTFMEVAKAGAPAGDTTYEAAG
jgi:pSer/pThr/pTyr-binding forkhead associated (FHA) protein